MLRFFRLKRTMVHCSTIVDVATKSFKMKWFFIVFSETDAVTRLLVDNVFIDQKSNIPGRKCFKNQWMLNDFVFQRLIDSEDEKIRFLRFVR